MKLKLFIFSILLFLLFQLNGQIHIEIKKINVDSLQQILPVLTGSERIDVLNKLSLALCRDNPDTSLVLAEQCIVLSSKIDYKKGIADGYFNKGTLYIFQDSLKPTVVNYLAALRIYEDLQPSIELCYLLEHLSNINWIAGRITEAKKYRKRAVKVSKLIAEYGLEIRHTQYIGLICTEILEFDSAYFYYDEALKLLDTHPDPNILMNVYFHYGYTTLRQYHVEEAIPEILNKSIFYSLKSHELAQEYADPVRIMKVYYNLGSAYIESGTEENIIKGMKFLMKVKAIADTVDEVFQNRLLVYNKLALLEYRKGNFEKAIALYKQGINNTKESMSRFSVNKYEDPFHILTEQYYYKVTMQWAYSFLFKLYRELGDFENALEYNILQEKAADDIFKEENKNLVALLEAESENEKTTNQIVMLEKKNEVKDLTIRQTRIYLFVLLGFILLLILFTYLFFRQRKIRVEIREQKLLHELEIKKMESDKLKELDYLKSRFFANISHEFRTPLTLIMRPLEKVLSKIEDTQHIKDLDIAKKYAEKLQILINNILTISKLESGKMRLHAVETNLVILLRSYLQSFESLANQKDIELKFTSKEKEITAWIDREKFEQVLNNLLSNAFKFTGEGGEVEVAVAVSSAQSTVHSPQSAVRGTPKGKADKKLKAKSQELAASIGLWVSINISDTGRGIPLENIDHIFDRFYQIEYQDNNYYEGTGIGLALTKELVELHQGTIEVESEPGKGSTFTITIPLGKEHLRDDEVTDIQDPATSIQDPASSNQQPVTSNQKPETAPILLIVEDNIDMRSYIREYFEAEYHIIEAVDGLDGFEKAKTYIPDIVISDVMMPKMDGNEFCKKVKTDERTSHIPVILLTARASSEYKIEGLETGADDYISKPFDQHELKVRLRNLIELRQKLRKKFVADFWKGDQSPTIQLPVTDLNQMDRNFLQKALEVVNLHFSEPDFDINRFSQEMALSRQQMHRKFRAVVDQSATEFIRIIRLKKAAELLSQKSGMVSEIAYDVGFSSLSYFSKCFQHQFGILPSEYAEKFSQK